MVSPKPSLELYVRSLGPSDAFERQERVLSHLDALATTGAIADYEVIVWGGGLVTDSRGARTAEGRRFLHRVLLLQHWYRINDGDLGRFLSLDDRDGGVSQSVSFEPLGLVEYAGSRIRFASPYADDDYEVGVHDHLASLGGMGERRLVPRTDAITVEDPRRAGRDHVESEPADQDRAEELERRRR